MTKCYETMMMDSPIHVLSNSLIVLLNRLKENKQNELGYIPEQVSLLFFFAKFIWRKGVKFRQNVFTIESE
jgi:hypothetical protein